MKTLLQKIGLGILCLILSACNYSSSDSTEVATTATKTLIPSLTPRPTSSPTITLSPTPTLFLPLANTPEASSLALSVENVSTDMERLARFGAGYVINAQYSQDGQYLYIQSYSGIYQYETGSYEQVGFFDTGASFGAFDLSPDGLYLLVQLHDEYYEGDTLTIWSTTSGSLIQTLDFPEAVQMGDFEYGSRGHIVASGNRHDESCIWGDFYFCIPVLITWVPSNSSPKIFVDGQYNTEQEWNDPIAFHPDGTTFAVGNRLYDAPTLQLLETVDVLVVSNRNNYFSFHDVAFSPDGAYLIFSAALQDSDAVLVFNMLDKKIAQITTEDDAWDLDAAENIGVVVVGGNLPNHQVLLIDFSQAAHGQTISFDDHVVSVSIRPDGQQIATITVPVDSQSVANTTVLVSDIATGQVIKSFEFDPMLAMKVGLISDGDQARYSIISGDSAGKVNFYDAVTQEKYLVLQKDSHDVYALSLSPDQTLLAVADANHDIHVWNLLTRTLLFTRRGDRALFSPDGLRLVTFIDCTASFWSLENVALQNEINAGCTDQIGYGFPYVFLPNGHLLSADESVPDVFRLIDIESGQVLFEIDKKDEFQDLYVDSLAVSPDGRYIAFGGTRPEIFIVDATTSEIIRVLKGHEFPGYMGDGPAYFVTKIQFSPTNNLLISTGIDGTTRFWDITTGSMVRVLNVGGGWWGTAEFSPDGRLVVTGDRGVVRLWGLPPWP